METADVQKSNESQELSDDITVAYSSCDLPNITAIPADATQPPSRHHVMSCIASQTPTDETTISTDPFTLSSETSAISGCNTDTVSMGLSVISRLLVSSRGTPNFSASETSAASRCSTLPALPAPCTSRDFSLTPYRTYLDSSEEEYLSDDCDLRRHISRTLNASSSTSLDSSEEEFLSDYFDRDLQVAISRSLNASASASGSLITLESLMEQIASRVKNDKTICFNIIRRNVWDGTSKAMASFNFSPENKIDVKFTDDYGISEGAVDNGGPTREFFRLCLREIKDSIGIFVGPPSAKVLTCNSKAMKDNGYFHAGQIMAMSIAHGGPSPCFLSSVLYECLQKGPDNVEVKTEHITDYEARSQVELILEAETESQLYDAVAGAANLISLAGHNVPVTLKNKHETALDLTNWYVLQRTRAPFERFKDGLSSLGVLEALQKHSQQLKCLFVKAEKPVTATDVENLFRIIHSQSCSSSFPQERRTLAFWKEYLQDAELKTGVSLEEILVFITGCDSIPALGFSPKPTIRFTSYSRFPLANTCENILCIPIHTVYATFKSDMDFAIRNSPEFGKA